jgi:hypothetical protein
MFELILKFSNLIDLQEFLKAYNKFQNKKLKTQEKDENTPSTSARGEAVKLLHIKAKQYKLDNPQVSYKECLKLINSK